MRGARERRWLERPLTMEAMSRLALWGLMVVCAAAADFQIEANIRYAPRDQTVLDILQPRAPVLKDRAGVIVIHGKDGSKEADEERFGQIFVDRGWVVAAVEYRADFAEEDVLKASQWLLHHAAEYRVDPKKIVACGGHLARLLSTQDSMVAAVIDIDGGFAVSSQPRRGTAPVLMTPDVTEQVFVWLKKHKIQ